MSVIGWSSTAMAARYQHVIRFGVMQPTVFNHLSSWAPFRSKPLEELQRADFLAGLCNKVLGQVEIVRQGIPYVTDGGSSTLTTGVVGREPVRTGASAALVNGALEYFVPAAAVELPRGLRINAVSPTVLREAPEYHSTFPDSSRSRRRP